MIEKPPCYGNPCLDRLSPCRSCGVLAACGRRLTQLGTFGLLMFPRIDPPAAAGGLEMPLPMLFDEKIERALADGFSTKACLTPIGKGRVWKWRKERVVVITEASLSRVAVTFPLVSPPRLSTMASARGNVQIGPLISGPTLAGPVSQAEIASRRAQALGSVMWAPNWEPIVDVVAEVAAAVFREGEA